MIRSLAAMLLLTASASTAYAGWTGLISGTSEHLYSVHFPTDAATGYVVGATGTILKTVDGGANWTPQVSGTAETLFSVHFPTGSTVGYAVGSTGTILKTTDGGATPWVSQSSGTTETLFSVQFPVDDNVGYAVGSAGTILKTSDGTNWSPLTSGTTNDLEAVHFLDATTGYAVGLSGTILKTVDGTTWSPLTSGTSEDLKSVHFPVDATTGWAVGTTGTALVTVNGGSSWTAQTYGTAASWMGDVFFPDAATGFVLSGSGGSTRKTTDGGGLWIAQDLRAFGLQGNSIYFPIDAVTGYIAGNSGRILKTTDGGGAQTILHPRGDSSVNNTFSAEVGCLTTQHWDCTNDETANSPVGTPPVPNDGTTSYVQDGNNNTNREMFELENGTLPLGTVVTAIEVFGFIGKGSGSTPSAVPSYQRVGIDLSPLDRAQFGNSVTSSGCCTQRTNSFWSGLSWTTTDVDALEVGIYHNNGGTLNVSQVFVVLTLDLATAVELVAFAAEGGEGAVNLEWETGSELDNLGFHLYRSTSEEGPYERITTNVIPGLGSSPVGAKYSYRDSGLTNGVTYYYQLEDIETTGATEFHGPVSATPQAGASAGDAGAGDGEGSDDVLDPDDTGSAQTAYGAPGEPSLRVASRTARSVVLELTTPGFVATQTPAGVRVSVSGFDERRKPRDPALPLKRALLDAVVGRHARIVWAKEKDVLSFPGLTPAAVGAAEVFVRPDGTVRPRRRRIALKTSKNGLLPRSAVKIAGDAFIGETKKLALEMSPIRYDTTSEELLLAQTLQVKIAFDRRARTEETGQGSQGRRRPRSARRGGTDVLAHLHTLSKGLHAVSFEELSLAEPIPLDSLRLSLLGKPVPFHVEPSGDFGRGSVLFFHAASLASSMDFSSETTYALERATGGLRMELLSAPLKGLPRVSSAPLAETRFETNRYYQAGLLGAPDIWLWDFLVGGMSKSVPFSIQGLDSASSIPAHIQVIFQGASEAETQGEHHLSVSLNGTPLGETSFDGKLAHVFATSFEASLLLEGENSLTLTNLGDTGAYSFVFLDRFDLVHPRTLVLRQGRFSGLFSEEGKAIVSGQAALGVDVTDPVAPQWLASLKERRGKERSGSVRFKTDAGHRYVLASSEGLLSPRISKPVRAKLRSRTNQADYVVIAPEAFLVAAQPLLERRQDQGLTTKAVSFEQITSQFGHGRPSAEAIRDFLAHAFHNWQTPSVKYVLLLGDASSDPRNFSGLDKGAPLPALWAKTSYLWTSSDPTLAAVNGEDSLPDLAIGRLPATTLEEAHSLVQKVLAWEDGAWDLSGTAILVADNPDKAGDFEADIADIKASFLGGRETKTLLLRQLGAQTRPEILAALDEGASLLSYVGHGGPAVWASENVLNSWDPPKLLAQPEQPLMLTFNCLNGYFVAPNYDSLAEAFMKAEGRGTIGAFSPSGLSLDGPAHRFHRALVAEITSGEHERLGDAVLAAQATYAETGIMPELLAVYHLFADPGMRIR